MTTTISANILEHFSKRLPIFFVFCNEFFPRLAFLRDLKTGLAVSNTAVEPPSDTKPLRLSSSKQIGSHLPGRVMLLFRNDMILGRKSWAAVICLIVLAVLGKTDSSTIEERMKRRCDLYADSVYEVVPSPLLLEGAAPKKRDTCRISSETTIVGGEEAAPREFPHMALIGYGDYPIRWRCGGSLISERWVISAAHCTATPDNLLAKYVLLGDLDVLSKTDENDNAGTPHIYLIVSRKNHPNYKKPSVYNDIALYKLNATVTFNPFIRPICLHARLPSDINQTVLASGWGATKYNGSASSHLLKVALDIVDNTRCNRAFPQNDHSFKRYLSSGISSSSQLCAWGDGKDTCQGDSGGPLQIVLKKPYCMYGIIGLTSIGNKCGAAIPSVYTRVHHYLSWIEPIVWPQKKSDKIVFRH